MNPLAPASLCEAAPPKVGKAMMNDFEANLSHIEPLPESQDELAGQLLDAQVIGNRLGLYDAADAIRALHLSSVRNPNTRLDLKHCFKMLPQMGQSQDSISAQSLRLAKACDILGLKEAGLKLKQFA